MQKKSRILNEEKSSVQTPKTHIKLHSMWAGKMEKASEIIYLLDADINKFIRSREEFSPALYKMIDEIIVNSIDHAIQYPKLVNNIEIFFDEDTGEITIYNDGPGIPVFVVVLVGDPLDKLTLREFEDIELAEEFCDECNKGTEKVYAVKWNPQILAEHPFSGKNFKKKEEIHIRGGTNGIGMKIVNYHSKWFKIKTIDLKRSTCYSQVFKDGANIIKPPDVDDNEEHEEGTTISFIPDYKKLGYRKDFNKIKKTDVDTIYKLIETRAYHAAAYLTKVNISFQKELIKINSLTDLIIMHVHELKQNDTSDYIYSTKIKPKRPAIDINKVKKFDKKTKREFKKINWDWDVCITPNTSSKKPERFSIMNGVCIPSGMHLSYIEDLLIKSFKLRMEKFTKETSKRWSDTYITNNINIFIKGCIDSPSFDSQSKSNLKEHRNKFEGYTFTSNDIKCIWNLVESTLLSFVFDKFDSIKKKNKTNLSNIPKYKPAKFAGTRSLKTKPKGFNVKKIISLFIPEGDSAMGLIDKGLSNKDLPDWLWEYNGIFSIQGVPLNARRFVTEIEDKKKKEKRIFPKKRLNDNERFSSLVNIIGLDFKKTYVSSKEFKELRYDRIIVAVDQDTDGKGNIFSLILGFISKFWPELIKKKYVQRMNTPIIRAISKAKTKIKNKNKYTKICKNFYSIDEYEQWKKDNFGYNNDGSICSDQVSENKMNAKWTIKYFKGLASTSESAIVDIFLHLEECKIIYNYTKESEKYFEIYLGKDSNLRKKELRKPGLFKIPIGETQIKCEDYLRSDLKEYQRENIKRSLPHSIDGLNPSRRKILCASMVYFCNNGNREQRVDALGGEIIKTMHYQHGPASLHATIIKMGQRYFGSNNLPLLKGVGLGSRKYGGKDAGAPRYVTIKLNRELTTLLYPENDKWMLSYVFSEGFRCEPEYYVPIFPMALVENIQLPAHGWQVCSWARDWEKIMKNLVRMINGTIETFTEMDINRHCWNGKIYKEMDELDPGKSRIYSVGEYSYNKSTNTILITELPHGVFSEYIIQGNRKRENKQKTKNKIIKKNIGHEYDTIDNNSDNEFKYLNEHDDQNSDSHVVDFTIKNKSVVQNIIDRSDDKNVHIEITLVKDGYEKIMQNHDSESEWSPIVEYFHLRRVIYDNLSFLNDKNEVVEYKKYESILGDFYKKRKALYIKRVDRNIIILQLQIQLMKYKNIYSINFDRYSLGKKTETFWNIKLSEEKFPKFNENVILNPKYTPIDEIIYYAKENEEEISYDYIYKMTQFQIMNSAIEKREKKINELKKELTKLKGKWVNFKGDRIWLEDLRKLTKAITTGVETEWKYNEPEIKYI